MRIVDGIGVGAAALAAGGLVYVNVRAADAAVRGTPLAEVREHQFSLTDKNRDGAINLDRTLPDKQLELFGGRRNRWVTDYSARYNAAAGGASILTGPQYERFLATFDRDGNGRLNGPENAALGAQFPTKRRDAFDPLDRR